MADNPKMKGTVLVVGSGISGMRATAELVGQGFKVFLLEEKPTIGGIMAQLDKMYPTNECATCTLLPKMLELTSNQNVKLITFAQLKDVEEVAGGFKIRAVKQVRYVDPAKCNACTECFAVCPVGGVPQAFNLGRGTSKAIYFWSPFPPRKALIDPNACTYIKEGKCGDGSDPLCVKACEPGAVDFSQRPTEVELEVGAIILATGAEEERGKRIEQFRYGQNPNVLTCLEYERLLSGLGPTGGVVKRDDGTIPKRLAWIVCEDFDGRQEQPSALCFMAAASEALGTLERDAQAEVFVVSGGPKTHGKGYEAFLSEAEKQGVTFVTTSSVTVRDGAQGGVAVACNGDGEEIAADMLVLSTPLVPSPGISDFADKIGIALNEDGLPAVGKDSRPLRTTGKGVFLAGTLGSPKGIRESVIHACAAAASAAARLAEARGTEIASAPAPELLAVNPTDEPRIAVVICRCGTNIAGALDLQVLVDYVSSLPHVAKVETTPFGCDGVKVKEMLGSGQYNRVVVGGCSPRTHEPSFQMITEAGGLNRYLMEVVNLRNQCTWVHRNDPEGLATKAKTLMRMGVARAALQAPLDPFFIPVTQSTLVIGATPAGLACAAKLGAMGFETHLVMSEEAPEIQAGSEAKGSLSPVLEALKARDKVTVYPNSKVGQLDGYVGNYEIKIHTNGQAKTVRCGAVVIATKEKMGIAGKEGDYEDALYVARDEDGFFIGALGNLNPLDFNTEGVFLCGSAREEESVSESVVSGEAAASRAACIVAHDKMTKSPVISHIVDENCDGCAYCIEPCPAHAITLIEYMKQGQMKKTVQVNDTLCRGCGMCMATCPKQGAFVYHFKPEYLSAMVKAVLEGVVA
jgi:heterodisulfide reductase subunit A